MRFKKWLFSVLLSLFILLPLYAEDYTAPSWSKASFDCKKENNRVEKLICEKNSYRLKVLDNTLAAEYKFLKKNIKNTKYLKNEQIAWLKKRNTCETKRCVEKLYQIRIDSIRYELIRIFKDRPAQCNADVYSAIFQKAAERQWGNKIAGNMTINGNDSEVYSRIDLDFNQKMDPSFILNIGREPCLVTANCKKTSFVVLDIDGCYSAIEIQLQRSRVESPSSLNDEILQEYNKGNYVEGVGVLTSYVIDGCAGTSGMTTYSALDKESLTFVEFADTDYDCGKATDTWVLSDDSEEIDINIIYFIVAFLILMIIIYVIIRFNKS